MPELPEVETVRRGLAPVLEGARFAKVEQRRADLRFPFPTNFAKRLKGRRVERLDRRAKYLLVWLDDGEVLAMHLGMSGRFVIENGSGKSHRKILGEFVQQAGEDGKHDHLILTMSNGAVIRYNDARRFGYMTLIEAAKLDEHPLFHGLGIEPLGNALTAGFLAARGKGRKQPLKAFLLDQRVLAGIGNIYACEALHRAKLLPDRPASVLALQSGAPSAAAKRLAPAVREVLEDALEAGGSSLRDYRQADGSPGYFQHRFCVYDREGKPCLRKGCGGTIARKVQSGRSTFYCPVCQK
jgi:formamidopyrimidine-DNA glycosylase